MLNELKTWMTRVGVKLGIIKELNTINEHRKVALDESAYDRILLDRSIYKGYVPKWHDLLYRTSSGEKRKRRMQSLGMGKVLAQKMAGLIFNEKAEIDVSIAGTVPTDGKEDPANAFIQETLRKNGFYKNFQRYLEYGYAMSGMAMKVYVHNGVVKLAYAKADAFFPLSHDSETIDEALFVSKERKGRKFYTLLEWHEWEGKNYVITNELYESEQNDRIGHKVPLATLYDDLQERTVLENLSHPLFVYFKLNTANNMEMDSPLGVSIFDNSYDTLYALDYMYDFFLHEFKLGKRRIAVDAAMLRPVMDPEKRERMAFDPDETVFNALNMENGNVTDLSVPLRTQEIIQAINAQLEILAMQTGFSAGTFTFDGQSVATATQVIAENSQTYQTRNSHSVLVEEGIQELVQAILAVGSLYGLYTGSLDVSVKVNFDDSLAEDRQSKYNYYSTAVHDELIPKREAIMRIFKLTEKQAMAWMEEIKEESVPNISPEASDLFGVPSASAENMRS